MTFAALNGKLKFVFEISTSTSLALPKVTAFLVVVSHLGRLLTFFVPSCLESVGATRRSSATVKQDPHVISRAFVNLRNHAYFKVTVDIQSLVLQHDLTLHYKC